MFNLNLTFHIRLGHALPFSQYNAQQWVCHKPTKYTQKKRKPTLGNICCFCAMRIG
ncbi:hypothetical protein HMPREF6745_2818 [Prevotella sp. oral taxon 472 str. F0295]|nr:hypothetical protein HMPREF6745_2818 [Prevotella sp. oral taxon 472 str. F0295]